MQQNTTDLAQDTPMHEWRPYSQEYLMERLRLEGRGDAAALQACPTCGIDEAPEYTCDECFEGLLECRSCFLSRHLRMPLHRAKVRVCEPFFYLC